MTVTDETPFLAPGEAPAPEMHDDPAAPYGRRSDGTPKAKPGRPKGTPNNGPRRPAPPRAKTRKAPPSGGGRRSGPDYRGGIMGLIQLAATPLVVAGTRSDAAMADAAALTVHGPPIADALHSLAQERPEVAAVLDRVLQAGPYGALLAAALPLAVQIATNHGLLPEPLGQAMGAHSRRDLVAMMRPEQPPQQRAEAPRANAPQGV